MDDFNQSSLHESKNEWGARLLTILTPHMIEGFKSIFDESTKLCKDNNEMDKYLMTFQNFITRIPKWNQAIVEAECARIIEKSGCHYLEELVTCVHIIQLKLLTAMRTGQKQKKIDINVPKLSDFIHKAYINTARKVYKNVYLFEANIPPLHIQKNNRELEIIVQECVLTTIRESIPVESILRAYMDESVEEDVKQVIEEHDIEPEPEPAPIPTPIPAPAQDANTNAIASFNSTVVPAIGLSAALGASSLSFNNVDMVSDMQGNVREIQAPKDLETLQKISELKAIERQIEDDLENDNIRLKIHDQPYQLNTTDVHVIDPPVVTELSSDVLGFEVLT